MTQGAIVASVSLFFFLFQLIRDESRVHSVSCFQKMLLVTLSLYFVILSLLHTLRGQMQVHTWTEWKRETLDCNFNCHWIEFYYCLWRFVLIMWASRIMCLSNILAKQHKNSRLMKANSLFAAKFMVGRGKICRSFCSVLIAFCTAASWAQWIEAYLKKRERDKEKSFDCE